MSANAPTTATRPGARHAMYPAHARHAMYPARARQTSMYSPRTLPARPPLTRSTREIMVFVVIALGAIATVAMWWADTPPSSLHGLGAWLRSAARITALVGTYLVVIEVLLMGRVAWLDRIIGFDRLAIWHRRNGEYSIALLSAHAFLVIWGYGIAQQKSIPGETRHLMTYPDIIGCTVGLGLFLLIGFLSAKAVRQKVNRETWYFIHLYIYLALALSFAHQFKCGLDFADHPLHRALWVALYAFVGAMLVCYRIVKPMRDLARHRLRVTSVVPEGSGTVSIYLKGRRLRDVRAEAGQFFMWRFLTKDHWWQAHPFSLSAAPNGRFLRLTVKALGDHSRALNNLQPGVRVIAEGPYGAFTGRRRGHRHVLLIAGGVGITPLRALYESLPGVGRDVTFIYRVDRPDEIVFKAELDEIARARRGQIHYLVGLRPDHPEYLSPDHLKSLVPDIVWRDVFVCGPPRMQAMVLDSLAVLRVPRGQVHHENFEL